MARTIVKKTFKNLYIRLDTINASLKLNTFALKAFNCLLHDWKVNRLLVASFLFSFSDYYSLTAIIKTINIALLKIKFELILGGQDFNQLDNIIYVDNRKMRLYLIYKNYIYHSLVFQKLSIYKYF